MGGSSSKSDTNVKTKMVVESVTKNIMDCSSNSSFVMRTVVSGNYNTLENVKQVFTAKLSANCVQDAKSIAEIQQSVANAIKAAAKAQSVTLTGALGKSSSEVNVSIDNEVRQAITQENITNIVNRVNLEQELVVSGNYNIIKNFSQDLTVDLVFMNSQKLINTLKSVQLIENDTDTTSEATQKSVVAGVIGAVGGLIDSIFSGMNTSMLIFLVFIVAMGYIFKDSIMAFLGFGPSPPPGQEQTYQDQTGQQTYQDQTGQQTYQDQTGQQTYQDQTGQEQTGQQTGQEQTGQQTGQEQTGQEQTGQEQTGQQVMLSK
jgi:hypothetical protein